jgi:hypothetical protein
MLLRVGDQNDRGEHIGCAGRLIGRPDRHVDGAPDPRSGKHLVRVLFAVVRVLVGEIGNGIIDRVVFVQPSHDGSPFLMSVMPSENDRAGAADRAAIAPDRTRMVRNQWPAA